MSDPVFRIRQNDTLGHLEVTLGAPGIGEPEELPEDASVRFIMRRVGGGSAKVSAEAEIVNHTDRRVRYEWQPGDTNDAGEYIAEFEVTYPATESTPERVRTYPTGHRLIVVVEPDLG